MIKWFKKKRVLRWVNKIRKKYNRDGDYEYPELRVGQGL